MSNRAVDISVILGAAIAVTISIVAWHDRPYQISAACAVVLVSLWTRYHQRRDIAGVVSGATLGNAVELACDFAGVWRHADRSLFGVAPAYIFICYPILGLAIPRLIDAIAVGTRPAHASTAALPATGMLGVFVALSMQFHDRSGLQSLITALMLAMTLVWFESRHDRVTAAAGLVIGLVWELPATLAGAWTFPRPQLFGLIPVWLPMAYAIFFVTMGRATACLAATTVSMPWPRWATPNPNNA